MHLPAFLGLRRRVSVQFGQAGVRVGRDAAVPALRMVHPHLPHVPSKSFLDRVREYDRYRPSYSVKVVRTLEREAGVLPKRTRIVDLGCGTGISAALFLAEGYSVIGVEPNAEMRKAAEAALGGFPNFSTVAGASEQIPLPDASCDLLLAAQALQWLSAETSRSEIQRLLCKDGWVALFWNQAHLAATEFLGEYEGLLRRYRTSQDPIAQKTWSDSALSDFFGPKGCRQTAFYACQQLDLAGLKGRALSSSSAPQRGYATHQGFMDALVNVFHRHSRKGTIRFEYETRLFYGRLSA